MGKSHPHKNQTSRAQNPGIDRSTSGCGSSMEGLLKDWANQRGCNHLPIVLNILIVLGGCPQRSKVSGPPGAGATDSCELLDEGSKN